MDEETITSSQTCNKFVKISTIADGNCLIHAILKACYNPYQENGDLNYRSNLSSEFRREISNFLTVDNPKYTKIEDVANLIRIEYKTEKPKHFLEFLRTMYNYTCPYIEYPDSCFEYKNNGKYYDIAVYRKYLDEYKLYILNLDKKYKLKSHEKFSSPRPKEPSYFTEPEQLLLPHDERMLELIKTAQNELEEMVNELILKLKITLESTLGYNLYLPNNFNKGVIEAVIGQQTDENNILPLNMNLIPSGKYNYLPFNCNLFTACKASALMRLEWEYCDIEGILCLGDMPRYVNSNNFIGEEDALMYIPNFFNINIVIIDFENNSIINIYETEDSNKFVIINNVKNKHFETIGIKIDDTIKTLFKKEDEIIQECFKCAKNEQSKCLNLNFLNIETEDSDKTKPKIIHFMNLENSKSKVPELSIKDILKNNLGDLIEIEVCTEFEGATLYIKYHQTQKTTYRFYMNDKGDIIFGNVPEKIRILIAKLLLNKK